MDSINFATSVTVKVDDTSFNNMLMKVVIWGAIIIVFSNLIGLIFSRAIGK